MFVGSDKVGTESPGLSNAGCNLKGLSRGLKFLFENSRTFKVRANPVDS